MDADIHEALKKIGDVAQSTGRLIASPKATVSTLQDMTESLDNLSEAVKIYRQIQIERYAREG